MQPSLEGVESWVLEGPLQLAGMEVIPFATPHDSAQSLGFRIQTADGRQFALATDLGVVTPCVREHLLGAEFVVLESNHDREMLRNGPYPAYLKRRILAGTGHLSNGDCAALLPELSALSERTADLAAEVEGLYADWQQVLESTDFSPEELTQVEERLNLLYDLSGKYGEDEAAMLDYLAKAEAELKAISSSAERIAALEAEQDSAGEVLIAAAAALTESRRKAGERFSAAVREELAFLNMPGVEFSVSIQPSSYNKTGADRVEFLISANAGEAPRPLAKVASGGELSRVMLAIKCVLAEKDAVPTLIFDEIDTGISGRAARAVGVKLKQVSRGRQVICITHLAQIAAMADNHMLIEKRVEGGRTFTAVERLSENDRVTEIARILSGGQLTESLEQTAREMIEYGKTV